MSTYIIAHEFDSPTLCREATEDNPLPEALAWTTARGNTVTSIDGGVVFRAAAAVLAPDEEIVLAVAAAIHKESCEECVLQARAVLAALRAHVEEATP